MGTFGLAGPGELANASRHRGAARHGGSLALRAPLPDGGPPPAGAFQPLPVRFWRAAARRSYIAVFFLGTHAPLLVARALWLGDPLAIPIHQLESGSLLIFTFFMISDPRTSPDSRLGRLIFAASVACAAHYMAFFMQ